MEEKLLDIFKQLFNEVPESEFTLDAEFKEWDQFDSLMLTNLLNKISEEFGIQLRIAPLVRAENIQDILDLIENIENN